MLYELLVLRPMFRADSSLQTIHKVRRAEVTTQLLEVKEILSGLDKVLFRALSLNPRHRYQRAFVLREDLRGLMAGFSFADIESVAREFLAPVFRAYGGAAENTLDPMLAARVADEQATELNRDFNLPSAWGGAVESIDDMDTAKPEVTDGRQDPGEAVLFEESDTYVAGERGRPGTPVWNGASRPRRKATNVTIESSRREARPSPALDAGAPLPVPGFENRPALSPIGSALNDAEDVSDEATRIRSGWATSGWDRSLNEGTGGQPQAYAPTAEPLHQYPRHPAGDDLGADDFHTATASLDAQVIHGLGLEEDANDPATVQSRVPLFEDVFDPATAGADPTGTSWLQGDDAPASALAPAPQANQFPQLPPRSANLAEEATVSRPPRGPTPPAAPHLNPPSTLVPPEEVWTTVDADLASAPPPPPAPRFDGPPPPMPQPMPDPMHLEDQEGPNWAPYAIGLALFASLTAGLLCIGIGMVATMSSDVAFNEPAPAPEITFEPVENTVAKVEEPTEAQEPLEALPLVEEKEIVANVAPIVSDTPPARETWEAVVKTTPAPAPVPTLTRDFETAPKPSLPPPLPKLVPAPAPEPVPQPPAPQPVALEGRVTSTLVTRLRSAAAKNPVRRSQAAPQAIIGSRACQASAMARATSGASLGGSAAGTTTSETRPPRSAWSASSAVRSVARPVREGGSRLHTASTLPCERSRSLPSS